LNSAVTRDQNDAPITMPHSTDTRKRGSDATDHIYEIPVRIKGPYKIIQSNKNLEPFERILMPNANSTILFHIEIHGYKLFYSGSKFNQQFNGTQTRTAPTDGTT
jgi:hypothetical protein